MRVIFCGSGDVAVPSLRAVWAGEHELVAVMTQPPRQAGRGRRMTSTPVAAEARRLGLTVVPCDDINADESLSMLSDLNAGVMVVADFGQFVRRAARATTRLGALNLHASLLPDLRGAAPINWAIINGYRRTGVTTFSLVDEMDAGDIYLQESVGIKPDDTAEDLQARLAELGANAICATLDGLAAGTLTARPQDHAKATLAPKLTKFDGLIDFNADAEEIRNRIHGTWPWPGGRTVLRRTNGDDVELLIARAEVVDEPAEALPGTLGTDLTVATGARRLRILRVRPAGKKLMTFKAFANGARLTAGDCMVTPAQDIS